METVWKERHARAYQFPIGVERPIVSLINAWKDYQLEHLKRYESPIGEDRILGEAWKAIGKGIRTMLNGELGRLDGGTLDGILYNSMREEGFKEEEL